MRKYMIGLLFMTLVAGGRVARADCETKFCQQFKSILAARFNGFAEFRGKLQTRSEVSVHWESTLTLPGASFCLIKEFQSFTRFKCLFDVKGEDEAQYNKLVTDVQPALPANWTRKKYSRAFFAQPTDSEDDHVVAVSLNGSTIIEITVDSPDSRQNRK